MTAPVKDKMSILKATAAQLAISKLAIARRYGCSHQFVYSALAGKVRCPKRLLYVVEDMIRERRRTLRRILQATSGKRRAS
jgi:hypothetical protein